MNDEQQPFEEDDFQPTWESRSMDLSPEAIENLHTTIGDPADLPDPGNY